MLIPKHQRREEPIRKSKPKSKGKKYSKWLQVRKQWFIANDKPSYCCYICDKWLRFEETTLDHIRPRGSHPQLAYEFSNLEPCCALCQFQKGSKSLRAYITERDKLGEHVSSYARKLAILN